MIGLLGFSLVGNLQRLVPNIPLGYLGRPFGLLVGT